MYSNLRSLIFACVTALVCSILLTGASMGLKPLQMRNMEIDRKTHILKSVGLVTDQDRQKAINRSPEWIEQVYANSIRELTVDRHGNIVSGSEIPDDPLPIWLYMENAQVAAYILPINSRGLWGKIYGYLALSNDGSTIIGFTVYKHAETPGLGGEIEKAWFQNNFKGKKIIDRHTNFVSIAIAKSGTKDQISDEQIQNYVDGISGATLTGQYLSAGFKDILTTYEPVSINFRTQRFRFTDME